MKNKQSNSIKVGRGRKGEDGIPITLTDRQKIMLPVGFSIFHGSPKTKKTRKNITDAILLCSHWLEMD